MVLEKYPDDVIHFVTDLQTGIQRRCKWVPSIAEIVEACDKRIAELQREHQFRNWGSRNKIDEPKRLEAPREERPTYDELKAKYGENFGLTPMEPKAPPKPAPSWEEIQIFYENNPERGRALIKALDRQGLFLDGEST